MRGREVEGERVTNIARKRVGGGGERGGEKEREGEKKKERGEKSSER